MHVSRRQHRNPLPLAQMLDLFSTVKPAKEPEPSPQPITEPLPAPKTEPVKASTFVPKQYIKQSDALPIYNAVVEHLTTHDVPPFSTFHLKSAAPNLLKWCIESPPRPQDQSSTPPNQLVLYMLVTRKGQNSEKPETTYKEWERIYSRSVNASKMPVGLHSKPRKARKARGSRSVTTTERDAS
jgi:hypothetical protein